MSLRLVWYPRYFPRQLDRTEMCLFIGSVGIWCTVWQRYCNHGDRVPRIETTVIHNDQHSLWPTVCDKTSFVKGTPIFDQYDKKWSQNTNINIFIRSFKNCYFLGLAKINRKWQLCYGKGLVQIEQMIIYIRDVRFSIHPILHKESGLFISSRNMYKLKAN